MNEGWIVLGIIVIFMLGAALPLLRKDTLRDWRKEK